MATNYGPVFCCFEIIPCNESNSDIANRNRDGNLSIATFLAFAKA